MAEQQGAAAPSEREQFEAHMRTFSPTVRLARQREALGGHYRTLTVQRAWNLWQAARRAQPTPPAVVEPLTDEQLYEERQTAISQLFDLAQQWADNKIHSYQFGHEAEKIVDAVARRVEAAHGIGIKKGDSNG